MPNCTCNLNVRWTDPDCPVHKPKLDLGETHHHHKSYPPRDGKRISDVLIQLGPDEQDEPPADAS
jgi:hypothetical protein